MLAEKKKKVHYVLNPRGSLWADDKSKFGQRMLEKMGWKEGKGLGTNEDGPTEHIRVSYKSDSTGLGYKGNPDTVEPLSKEYGQVLARLNELHGNSTEPKKETKVRHRYSKVLAAKTVSNYSATDLAAIFGTTVSEQDTSSHSSNEGTEEQRKNWPQSESNADDSGSGLAEQSTANDRQRTEKKRWRKSHKQDKLSRLDSEPCEPLSADGSELNRRAKKGPTASSALDNSAEEELPSRKRKKRKVF